MACITSTVSLGLRAVPGTLQPLSKHLLNEQVDPVTCSPPAACHLHHLAGQTLVLRGTNELMRQQEETGRAGQHTGKASRPCRKSAGSQAPWPRTEAGQAPLCLLGKDQAGTRGGGWRNEEQETSVGEMACFKNQPDWS